MDLACHVGERCCNLTHLQVECVCKYHNRNYRLLQELIWWGGWGEGGGRVVNGWLTPSCSYSSIHTALINSPLSPTPSTPQPLHYLILLVRAFTSWPDMTYFINITVPAFSKSSRTYDHVSMISFACLLVS